MMKNLKIFLILFVSVLIVSITPAMAVQTGQNSDNGTVSDDWDDIWYKAVSDVINNYLGIFDDQELLDTELTVEQQEYLDACQDRIVNKSDNSLNNLQDILNYLKNEYNRYNMNTGNFNNKRTPTPDDFTTDIKDIISELNKIHDIQVNYENLDYNGTKNLWNNIIENKTYDGLIIQIRDGNYPRYMQITNITDDIIYVKSPKKEFPTDRTKFVATHSLNGSFNVIKVPKDVHDTPYTLNKIMEYQMNVYTNKDTWYITLMALAPGITTLGMSGYVVYGITNCHNRERRQVVNQTRTTVTDTTILLGVRGTDYHSITTTRDDLTDNAAAAPPASNNRKIVKIIMTGVVILAANAGIIGLATWLKIKNDQAKENLKTY